MSLNTKSFDALVEEQATAIEGKSSRALIDFSIGSVLRAIVEAIAAVVMWLQGLILQLLAATRAATATGTDLDSWVADYGLTRLPAVAATGQVTFSRFTATAQAIVPVGSLVQTQDGSQRFVVTEDDSYTGWNTALGGYVMAPGTASIIAPVSALNPGTAGNAVEGAVNTLGQAIIGIDTVTNAAAFVTGEDAESDTALRSRFQLYIASLSKATKAAVSYAISSVQQGLSWIIVENQSYAGATDMGYFYAVADDGSGATGTPLLNAVATAIDLVRPITSRFGVFAATVVNANVAMSITTAAGYDHTSVASTVKAAIIAYINALPLGGSLDWSRLFQIAYDASPGVSNVSAVTLNGGTSDLAISAKQTAKAGTVTIA
ncbi:MAG TPA: baseplate J/gp47 family protein [Sphingobium sp.]|uniref:baseplate J/gp47 family protein n=1 Tax=Sphingobium sp. TaxID=1912891 RepID=UPI002ED4908C